jgi:hypothetical protein
MTASVKWLSSPSQRGNSMELELAIPASGSGRIESTYGNRKARKQNACGLGIFES